jgi:hypothetical protein
MQLIVHRPWFSNRGLAPHQFMPMPGTHRGLQCTLAIALRTEPGRQASYEKSRSNDGTREESILT